jgi:4-amino-4-deoxy-L-arabinose transferase-like glycosyltransferase
LRGNKVLLEDHRKKKAVYLLVLLAFSYLFLFHHLGSYSLKEPDEGRYAEIPREMVEQGDYVVPHLNYVRYFEKPPLLYWVTALSYKALGVSEWSVRLPNAILALCCMLAVYFFAARRFGEECAFVSSFMLVSSFGFFGMARVVTIDMLLSFLLFASVLCFYEFYQGRGRRYLYLFYASLALSVLAKGPVGVILCGATIGLFLLIERRLSFLKEMASLTGILLFVVIAAPWFILVSLKEREFFQFFFIDQNFTRFLTTRHKRSGPIYYFIPVILGGLFPWSLFIPRAVARFWKDGEMRLFLIWSGAVFAFFSVSGSKLIPYVLPVFPALSIVLGRLFTRQWDAPVRRAGEMAVYGVFFLALALGGFAAGSGLLSRNLPAMPELTIAAGPLRGLALGLSVAAAAMIILLAARRMRRFGALFYGLGAFSAAVAIGLTAYTPVIDGFNTTKNLARAVVMGSNDAAVVNYGTFDETLPFYTGRRTYIADYRGELEMGSRYADGRPFFLDKNELLRLFRSDRPVFVVCKAKRLSGLKELGIVGVQPPLCQDNRCLIANRRIKGE